MGGSNHSCRAAASARRIVSPRPRAGKYCCGGGGGARGARPWVGRAGAGQGCRRLLPVPAGGTAATGRARPWLGRPRRPLPTCRTGRCAVDAA
jgi:hypothetical protein